jgi:regulation of enolase protein 1 (concanavalin A-like superfamily)
LLGLYFAIVNPFSRGERISWTQPNSDKLNSPLFRWERGEDSNSNFDLISSNTLRITAASQTDLKLTPGDQKKQSPMMVFPIQGDFEASVKVSFKSSTKYQRAILGVRNTDNKYQQVFLLLAEDYMLEIGAYNSGQPGLSVPRIHHNSEIMYLKIKRQLGSVALSYSKNGWQWSPVTSEFQSPLSNNVEVFFGLLSASNSYIAAEFSDFSLKRL